MRESAPPYAGEGPHALWHVSEDATIGRFEPHLRPGHAADEPLVRAIDTRHQPLYWFPWISHVPVEPLELVDLGDLLALHASAGIELRLVPTLLPLFERVLASPLGFSGIRLRNAAGVR